MFNPKRVSLPILLFVISYLLIVLAMPALAADYQYDLGVQNKDIFFSKDVFIIGDQVRIYASIHNYGEKDVSGYVSFYQSDQLIGDSQIISVRAGGLSDEVFVDWTVPESPTNIRVRIKGQSPQDENPLNDEALSSFITPDKDTDGDGIPDGKDADDDNDGVPDSNEVSGGTSATNPDTDKDGVLDGQDAFPLDPKKSALPEPTKSKPEAVVPSNLNSASNKTVAKPAPLPAKSSPPQVKIEEKTTEGPEPGRREEDEKTSPGDKALLRVSINYIKKDWDTFIFESDVNKADVQLKEYRWDFGDGVKSSAKTVEHSFKKSGAYYVVLEVVDDMQSTAEDQVRIDISFFNLGNWRLWLALGFLIILTILVYLSSKYGPKDRGAVEEEVFLEEGERVNRSKKKKMDL